VTGARSRRRRDRIRAESGQLSTSALARKLEEARRSSRGAVAAAGAALTARLTTPSDPPNLTDEVRIQASEALTPAEWRDSHGFDDGRFSAGRARKSDRLTAPGSDYFNPRRTEFRPIPAPSPDGRWSEGDVRARLQDAMETLWRDRFPAGEIPSGRVCARLEVARTAAEIWEAALNGLDRPRLIRAAPAPDALRRLDEVLPWLFLIDDVPRRLALQLRLAGFSLRKTAVLVSEEMKRRGAAKGVSHPAVERWEADGVKRITAALNGRRERGAVRH